MRRRYRPSKGTGEARAQVRGVFQELRQLGFIARMNFLCCSSCASYELGTRWDKQPTKKGVVYFHRQNDENYRETGCLCIHYFGGQTGDSGEEASRKTKEVGDIITGLLSKRGVVYRWDGRPGRTIEVYDNEDILEAAEKRERERAEEVARYAE